MSTLEARPVDTERWDDVVALFGPSGIARGCWCMARRLPSSEFQANGTTGNRSALERLIRDREPVGLLFYTDGAPIAWCAVAPRSAHGPILRSTTLPIDDPEDPSIWAVTCLFVKPGRRRQGLTLSMVQEAVGYAAASGARIVEAYPAHSMPADPSRGTLNVFLQAGFEVHAKERTTAKRNVVVRHRLRDA